MGMPNIPTTLVMMALPKGARFQAEEIDAAVLSAVTWAVSLMAMRRSGGSRASNAPFDFPARIWPERMRVASASSAAGSTTSLVLKAAPP